MFDPSKNLIGNFTPNDGTIDFYLRVSTLINKKSTILDLGAGRAAWFDDDNVKIRKNIRLMKGKVKKIIGADIDPAVFQNKAVDERIILNNGLIPLDDESIDLVIADYVLEHVENPREFMSEISRVLKKGGYICARTPSKWCYQSIVTRLVQNKYHQSILKKVQPERRPQDVFDTTYKLNTKKDIEKYAKGFKVLVQYFRPNPSYFMGNSKIYKILSFLHRVFPVGFSGNLFIFLRKK